MTWEWQTTGSDPIIWYRINQYPYARIIIHHWSLYGQRYIGFWNADMDLSGVFLSFYDCNDDPLLFPDDESAKQAADQFIERIQQMMAFL